MADFKTSRLAGRDEHLFNRGFIAAPRIASQQV